MPRKPSKKDAGIGVGLVSRFEMSARPVDGRWLHVLGAAVEINFCGSSIRERKEERENLPVDTRWRPTCRHQQLSSRNMRLPRPGTMKKATPGLATILLTTSHDRPRRTSNPRRSNTCLRDHRNAHRRGIPSSLPPLHADRPTPVTMGGS